MPWFKVDDRLYSHPKLAALEAGKHFAEAVALWCIAGSWCASQLTDGGVPMAQLRRLVPFDARKAAGELVRVRLWEEVEDGYRFRSWDEYQPSRESVVTKRQKTAAKVASWRDRNQVTEQSRNPVTSSDVTTSVTLPPTRPDPTRPAESATHSPARARDRSPDATRGERIRKGYLERFAKACPGIAPVPQAQAGNGGPWLDLGRLLTDEQCGPFLDAYFADDFCRQGHKMGTLTSERVRLLTSGPKVGGQPAAPVAPPASGPLVAAREAYSAACERVRQTEGTMDYDDAVDAKRAAQRAMHAAEGLS